MAFTTVTHTFANSTTTDAPQVNTNFSDILAGMSDGTKDHKINTLTVGGISSFSGNSTFNTMIVGGQASFTGNTTHGTMIVAGSSTFTGNALFGTIAVGGQASFTGNLTAGTMVVGGQASFSGNTTHGTMIVGGQASFTGNVQVGTINVAGTATFVGAAQLNGDNSIVKGLTSGSSQAAGYIGEVIIASLTGGLFNQSSPAGGGGTGGNYYDITNLALTLTAGSWNLDLFTVLQVAQNASATGVATPILLLRQGTTTIQYQQLPMAINPGLNLSGMVGPMYISETVNISTATTYHAAMAVLSFTGSPTVVSLAARYDNNNAYSNKAYLRGTRIG